MTKHLLCKFEALNSNPDPPKEKKRERKTHLTKPEKACSGINH
jgi:hypothetical protein